MFLGVNLFGLDQCALHSFGKWQLVNKCRIKFIDLQSAKFMEHFPAEKHHILTHLDPSVSDER